MKFSPREAAEDRAKLSNLDRDAKLDDTKLNGDYRSKYGHVFYVLSGLGKYFQLVVDFTR